ncbi:hypothetical protein [Bradyrhizobium retamae]|uniref:Uncharacterized protein n=1 Tax=Bradyrhizobium retamae TaxID=1300035 RepID=A0A0R3MVC0_9BRAD|nr:hypothetical protein [Bradyrhizobium retamae]KRR22143.1 hypothetical protein CQ13_29890 [Bradyrhizobium retamae]
MAKPKNNRRSHFSRSAAIALHAEANKSDPFAAKRIAMTIARDGHKEAQETAKESKRLLDAGNARLARRTVADWLSNEQVLALVNLRDGLLDAQAQRRKPKKHLTMSMFVSKADLEAARAA